VGEQGRGIFFLKDIQSERIQVNKVTTCELWHHRLRHPNQQVMSLLSSSISDLNNKSMDICDACFRTKQTRMSFPISNNKASYCFDLIHCDIWGLYRVESLCGAYYFLDASHGTWVFFIKEKSEASKFLKNFCLMIKTQFGKCVKVIQSDNGAEFTSGPMKQFYGEEGIIHQTSCTDTPQQNGRVQRKNRHILNVARALCFQANLLLEFWEECVLTATYLINRTPASTLNGKTPYEILFQAKPTYEHTKVFDSLCYVHQYQRQKDKFSERSRRCVFVGYPFAKKGRKVYDLETNELFVSLDVIFHEDIFPFLLKEKKKPKFGKIRECHPFLKKIVKCSKG